MKSALAKGFEQPRIEHRSYVPATRVFRDVHTNVNGVAVSGTLAMPSGIGVSEHSVALASDEPRIKGRDCCDTLRHLGRIRSKLLKRDRGQLHNGTVNLRDAPRIIDRDLANRSAY